ncbi:MAG TPA: pilus assembly protein TadG-related protein [Microthrixaceae bacterium]|nr:pilus assembly protein TadG-related protein [Microthrixaceae bacterium]
MTRRRVRALAIGGERGTVTVFVVTMTTALLLVAGLVFDGGRMIAARRDADAVAAAAARAGAQGLDEAGLRATDAAPLDPAAAQARAQRYLAATPYTGNVAVVGDTVSVDVARIQDVSILSLAGVGSSTVTGSGAAIAVRAVTEQP